MNLIPLGRRAGMPVDGEASSGYLVRAAAFCAVLDAGPGTAARFTAQHPAGFPDVVFISHEHTDHLWDLLPLGKVLLDRRLSRDADGFPVLDERARIPLLVPEGAAARLTRLAELYPVTTFPVLDRVFEVLFDVVEYGAHESLHIAGADLTVAAFAHAAPDAGIRIQVADRSLVYTGDTGPTAALPELAAGASTLLAECSLTEPDRTGHGHLCAADAARAAAEAGVVELVLTHFSTTDPESLAHHRRSAAEHFDGPIRIAEIGVEIGIPPQPVSVTPRKVPA